MYITRFHTIIQIGRESKKLSYTRYPLVRGTNVVERYPTYIKNYMNSLLDVQKEFVAFVINPRIPNIT